MTVPSIPAVAYTVHFTSDAGDRLIVNVTVNVSIDGVANRFDEVIEAATISAVAQGVDVDRFDADWDVEVILAGGYIVWPHLPS